MSSFDDLAGRVGGTGYYIDVVRASHTLLMLKYEHRDWEAHRDAALNLAAAAYDHAQCMQQLVGEAEGG